MQVWVIEYTDSDGKGSAQGVFTSEEIGVAWIKEQIKEMIENCDYEGEDAEVREYRTRGTDYRGFALDAGNETWELVPMELTDKMPPPAETPLEDQHPQHTGDRGTIGPEDRCQG